MADKGYRIVLHEVGDVPRAVAKIQRLSDGGYCLISPYHSAKEGWLAKCTIDYRTLPALISLDEMQHFTVSDRVKLSHHYDGFVQFSGENPQKIKSGINALTGRPRGLGIWSAPIHDPITTGSTFGIMVWGLHGFKPAADPRHSDVLFAASDMYDHHAFTEGNHDAYLIQGWIFDQRARAAIRGSGNDLRLIGDFAHFPRGAAGAEAEFRVIPLRSEIIGVKACRIKVKGKLGSPSGFDIGGPSSPVGPFVSERLSARYPNPEELSVSDYDPTSLDYGPRTPNER